MITWRTPKSGSERTWQDALAVYRDRRMAVVLLLGFVSGLPLALTFGTLSIWLTESGVDKTAIGLFALTGIPYTFKFFWAPLVDHLSLPFLTARLGRRRGWTVASQLALIVAILALGNSHPAETPGITALLALLVAFCSATQDIVIDAYRVEILEKHQYAGGAAIIIVGYRLGMLVSGAGALYLASYLEWSTTYALMALFLGMGMIAILFSPEPVAVIGTASVRIHRETADPRASWRQWFHDVLLTPFSSLLQQPGWLAILTFILLYKLGDAMAGVMSNPFYLETGFSKIEIANISKLFGLGASLLGGLIGGAMAGRWGMMRLLWIGGLLQMFSNLMFVVLAWAGRDLLWLTISIAVENICCGIGSAALVAYLSSLCQLRHTASQYALLSSLAVVGRTLFSSPAGWLANRLDWIGFFLFTTAAALPGMLLLLYLSRRDEPPLNDLAVGETHG